MSPSAAQGTIEVNAFDAAMRQPEGIEDVLVQVADADPMITGDVDPAAVEKGERAVAAPVVAADDFDRLGVEVRDGANVRAALQLHLEAAHGGPRLVADASKLQVVVRHFESRVLGGAGRGTATDERNQNSDLTPHDGTLKPAGRRTQARSSCFAKARLVFGWAALSIASGCAGSPRLHSAVPCVAMAQCPLERETVVEVKALRARTLGIRANVPRYKWVGAEIALRPRDGLALAQLQHQIDCHWAVASADHVCPLGGEGFDTEVAAEADAYRVTIRASDPRVGRLIMRRAQSLGRLGNDP